LDGLLPLQRSSAVFGADGMSAAQWHAWSDLPKLDLAFDHKHILTDAEKYLSVQWQHQRKPKP
jgi:hypothetical protein